MIGLVTIWLWYYLLTSNRLIVCVIETEPNKYPTNEQLLENCTLPPIGIEYGLRYGFITRERYEVERASPIDYSTFCTIEDIPTGPGLLDMPSSPGDLYTSNSYELLENRLIWYGIDDSPLLWQNMLDAKIYQEGIAANIPPRLLKSIIAVESQFWPIWGQERATHGEQGLIQLTESGADLALRYDATLYKYICHGIIYNCNSSYHVLKTTEQEAVARALVASLACLGCSPSRAMAKENINIYIYARVIRAYGCKHGYNWVEAMREYNGSQEYPAAIGIVD